MCVQAAISTEEVGTGAASDILTRNRCNGDTKPASSDVVVRKFYLLQARQAADILERRTPGSRPDAARWWTELAR
eukprot:8159098-Pyramimonas_sp.AAC.1